MCMIKLMCEMINVDNIILNSPISAKMFTSLILCILVTIL